MYKSSGKLFVVSAPSGAGKTTLVNALVAKSPDILKRVITYTTKPKAGNSSDFEYHFISVVDFQDKIAQGFFLEWSTAYGTYYGSPKSIIDDIQQGMSYIMIVDRAGAQAIVSIYPCAILIWIYTVSLLILKNRLHIRARDNHEQIEKRLALAQAEIKKEAESPIYNHHICNDVFFDALGNLENIVLEHLDIVFDSAKNMKSLTENQG